MEKEELLRLLPGVDTLLEAEEVIALAAGRPRRAMLVGARAVIEGLRRAILAGEAVDRGDFAVEVLAYKIRDAADDCLRLRLRPVINATGIIVHTNLGRSPLAPAATAAATAVTGYANLEYDLSAGHRGRRAEAVETLLVELTGAQAALAVNNNAAAVILVLAALAAGREVVISRGELIEIGGSFRIPDIMAAGGCKMIEVGTTNKTHASDYERALGPETAVLMKVHTSNYRIVGFTASVELAELVKLGRRHELPVVEDLGSGALISWPNVDEPTVAERIKSGADLVTFSGDKLLGGPQSGLIVGRRDLIDRLRVQPLYRALRLDKMSLAALEATLRIYAYGNPDTIPVAAAIKESARVTAERAKKLAALLAGRPGIDADFVPTTAFVGGGALPERDLPSHGVRVRTSLTPDELAEKLRRYDPPIVARVVKDLVLLDMIAVDDDSLEIVAAAIR